MGNTTSSKRRVPSINNNSLTVDLFSSDTTNQLIQLHVSSQNITDILNQSITLDNEENQVYNSLIDQDTITARVWAAQCKIYGFGTEKNVSEGFRELLQLKQFKEAFYPIACYYYEKKKYDYAYHYFYKLRKDNHFAQYRIALMLFRGQGTLINHEKAFRYMKLAASNNNKYAQFILGFYYEHGVLVKQSISTAKLWYERSANQGFSDAQLAMANLLLFDLTQLQDDTNLSTKHKLLKDEALDWLYKAIEQVRKKNAQYTLPMSHIFIRKMQVHILDLVLCMRRGSFYQKTFQKLSKITKRQSTHHSLYPISRLLDIIYSVSIIV